MKTDSNIKKLLSGSVVPLRLTGVVYLFLCLFVLQTAGVNAVESESGFNHFSTGFPLEGAHEQAACTSCHMR
jgi:hypothetical protein